MVDEKESSSVSLPLGEGDTDAQDSFSSSTHRRKLRGGPSPSHMKPLVEKTLERLRRLLVDLRTDIDNMRCRQLCYRYSKPVEASCFTWYNDAKDDAMMNWTIDATRIAYDLENLIEDVELAESTDPYKKSLYHDWITEFSQAPRFAAGEQQVYELSQMLSIDERIDNVLHRRLANVKSWEGLIDESDGDFVNGFESGDRHPTCPNDIELPWYLQLCYAFCSLLFPINYLFEKDLLVLWWLGAGLVQPVDGKTLEDVSKDYFDELVKRSYLSIANSQEGSSISHYKAVYVYHWFHTYLKEGEFSQVYNTDICLPERVRHASLPSNLALEQTFNMFSKSTCLRTLLLLPGEYSSHISKLFCSDHFLHMPYLYLLDLSYTDFEELPVQVTKLIHLRHLDLSHTRIRYLPGGFGKLFHLLTLRLLDCSLTTYPDDFHGLVNLRHLHLPMSHSMPCFIGKLTSLQTLTVFYVLPQEGCHISELGELNSLHGNLVIEQLGNVESFEDAKQAQLHLKQHLESLCLSFFYTTSCNCYDIIRGLRPHPNLSKLEISCYEGSCLPSWLSEPSMFNLRSIKLSSCSLDELPPLGQLPCLNFLVLDVIRNAKQIDDKFYGAPNVKQFDGRLDGLRMMGIAFQSLLSLEMDSIYDLERWMETDLFVFPMLQKLSVSWCEKLEELPTMNTLCRLRDLELLKCPKLKSLPLRGLPTSIQSLKISGCPILEEICKRDKGAYWKKIAHIPFINIRS